MESFIKIEKFLLTHLENEEKTLHIKELNEQAMENGCVDVTTNKIKTILNFWSIKNWIKRQMLDCSNNYMSLICLIQKEDLETKLAKRHELAQFILEYLYEKININSRENDTLTEEALIEFSVFDLKKEFDNRVTFFNTQITLDDIEDTLYYLSKIEALKIEGGFLVVYNGMGIERIEQDNKKRYKVEDYQKLGEFYQSKIQQIHIVREYARKMISNYKEALQFVDDYFQLNYTSFLNKYFKGSRQEELRRNVLSE
jgi:ATP-dependent DNA helicase RecQ